MSMMKMLGSAAAIYLIVITGFAASAMAADASGCQKEVQGQLVIAGADSECLPSEYCFGMADYGDALRFRIGANHIGGNYYTLSGIENDQEGNPSALSGSAVKIDDMLLMTVTTVRIEDTGRKDSFIEAKFGTIKLNLKTSDVSFGMLDIDAYGDGSEHIGDSYDSLNYIKCPK